MTFSGGGVPAGRARRYQKVPAACELLCSDEQTSIYGCALAGAAGGSSGVTCFVKSMQHHE